MKEDCYLFMQSNIPPLFIDFTP